MHLTAALAAFPVLFRTCTGFYGGFVARTAPSRGWTARSRAADQATSPPACRRCSRRSTGARRSWVLEARPKKVVADPDEVLTGPDGGGTGEEEKDGEAAAESEVLSRNVGREDEEPAELYEPEEWEDRLSTLCVAVCLDRDGGSNSTSPSSPFQQLRVPNMLNHMAWGRRSTRIEGSKARVIFDRTVLTPDLQATCGNVIGIACEAPEDALELFAKEPYTAAGLYERSELYLWPRSNHSDLTWDRRPFSWLLYAEDKPKSLELRLKTRPDHVEYLISSKRVTGAGPLIRLSDKSQQFCGSLVTFNAETREEAEQFAENDPYAKVGLFKTVLLRRYNDLDVDGRYVVKPQAYDPLRDIMAKEGLALPDEFVVESSDSLV